MAAVDPTESLGRVERLQVAWAHPLAVAAEAVETVEAVAAVVAVVVGEAVVAAAATITAAAVTVTVGIRTYTWLHRLLDGATRAAQATKRASRHTGCWLSGWWRVGWMVVMNQGAASGS